MPNCTLFPLQWNVNSIVYFWCINQWHIEVQTRNLEHDGSHCMHQAWNLFCSWSLVIVHGKSYAVTLDCCETCFQFLAGTTRLEMCTLDIKTHSKVQVGTALLTRVVSKLTGSPQLDIVEEWKTEAGWLLSFTPLNNSSNIQTPQPLTLLSKQSWNYFSTMMMKQISGVQHTHVITVVQHYTL